MEQIHFIGKDIIYFHTLFWPAMLEFAGRPYKVPDHVYVHGFLTVSGEKMSKSRGTGISPLRYLELGMNPEWLRYYIAAKLNANVEDLDFNPDDFLARVNSDLVGKYVNIASRVRGFISKRFGGELRAQVASDRPRHRSAVPAGTATEIAACYEAARVRQGVARSHGRSRIEVNQCVDQQKPWELAKQPGARRASCTASARDAIDAFRMLTV